jgi:DNA polymerase-3 subunit gamma/tau
LSAEAIEAVQQQAAQLDQLRLLELVERCAEAEQRMKWAPNKKMHVEIAVIRAIQTLNQATLGEILDTLTAMRGGGPLPEAATKQAAPARTAPSRSSPAPTPRAAPIPAPTPGAVRPEQSSPAPREVESLERKPSPNPPGEEVPRLAEAPTPTTSETPSIPVAEVWPAVVQRVRKERPLQAANVERAVLMELKDGKALVAVDTKDALAFDMLEAPNMRKFLEGILADLAGSPLSIKLVKRDGIAPTVAPAAAPVVEAPKDPMTEFKNDALIRKALEIFKADIQPA